MEIVSRLYIYTYISYMFFVVFDNNTKYLVRGKNVCSSKIKLNIFIDIKHANYQITIDLVHAYFIIKVTLRVLLHDLLHYTFD